MHATTWINLGSSAARIRARAAKHASTVVLLAIVAVLVLVELAQAGTSATTLDMQGVHVTCTVTGTSNAVTASDKGTNANDRAAVIAAVVSGQAIKGLVRFHRVGRTEWVDVVLSDTVTNLTTAANSMSLGAAAPGHPSPTHDAVDDEVLATAGG